MAKSKKPEHPMQPIVWDKHRVIRFKENKIIGHLFETRLLDLNALAAIDFPREDSEQLAQLLGYSVSGFGDLSYARPTTVAAADKIAARMAREKQRGKRK